MPRRPARVSCCRQSARIAELFADFGVTLTADKIERMQAVIEGEQKRKSRSRRGINLKPRPYPEPPT